MLFRFGQRDRNVPAVDIAAEVRLKWALAGPDETAGAFAALARQDPAQAAWAKIGGVEGWCNSPRGVGGRIHEWAASDPRRRLAWLAQTTETSGGLHDTLQWGDRRVPVAVCGVGGQRTGAARRLANYARPAGEAPMRLQMKLAERPWSGGGQGRRATLLLARRGGSTTPTGYENSAARWRRQIRGGRGRLGPSRKPRGRRTNGATRPA